MIYYWNVKNIVTIRKRILSVKHEIMPDSDALLSYNIWVISYKILKFTPNLAIFYDKKCWRHQKI